MSFKALELTANETIFQIDRFIEEEGEEDNGVLESIMNQMIFIRDAALVEKNPFAELEEGRTFTFGILASREFASPRELELQDYIYDVFHELIKFE